MPTIRLSVQKDWDVHENRESLYVELDLETLRDFIAEVVDEKIKEKELG